MQRNVIETILNTLHTEFGLMGATTLNEHVPGHAADCSRPQSHLPMTLHVSRSVFQTVLSDLLLWSPTPARRQVLD